MATTYEEQAEQRAAQHRDNWEDEPLTWWDRLILELPDDNELTCYM